MPELPPEADALYGLSLEEFTPARNELAKQLRKDKRKDEAALVAKLRKPPVTAWALNQLAQAEPARITAVEEAGAALRSAMEQALTGDRSALTEAQSAERRAIQQAVEAAAELMASAGHAAADTARRRMGESLRTAVLDPETWERLRSGTLGDDVEATGLGLGLVGGPGAGSGTGPGEPASSAGAGSAGAGASAGAASDGSGVVARREIRKAEAARRAEESEAQRILERRVHELESELDLRRRRADRLTGQLEAAEAELAELRRAASEAAAAVEEIVSELESLRP